MNGGGDGMGRPAERGGSRGLGAIRGPRRALGSSARGQRGGAVAKAAAYLSVAPSKRSYLKHVELNGGRRVGGYSGGGGKVPSDNDGTGRGNLNVQCGEERGDHCFTFGYE